MKKILVIFAALGLMAACGGEEYDRARLSVGSDALTLDAKGTAQVVEVSSDNSIWTAKTDADWIILTHNEDGTLGIGAPSNSFKTARSANVYVSSQGGYGRVKVTQSGGLREIGEPYPNADAPEGIIVSLTDGGEHGFVLSLQQQTLAWGPAVETPAAHDLLDGAKNTRAIIETHGGEAGFATDYPAFNWVNTLNGGDLDGKWFIPAWYQLVEMQHLLTGSNYIMPDPKNVPAVPANTIAEGAFITHADIAFRDALNQTITDLGGVPLTYTGSIYWSSSEVDTATTYMYVFSNGSSQNLIGLQQSAKTKVRTVYYPVAGTEPVAALVRPIMKF